MSFVSVAPEIVVA
ncbi:hypothetical protein LDE66_00690, partial [Mycobacterium tuberculosis]